jgi:replicative DNA helicase
MSTITPQPDRHTTHSRPITAVIDDMTAGRQANGARPKRPFPTGFLPLDHLLNGGFKAHDLTLLGGQPAVGKTIVTLQWAREMALNDNVVIYVCYEHDEAELLSRLLSLELGEISHPDNAPAVDKLRMALRETASGHRGLQDILDSEPLARAAFDRVAGYSDRLVLARGSGRYTDLAALEALVVDHGNGHNVLIVDYLQKVAMNPPPQNEAEKVTVVAEGLKDIALNHDIAVIAVTAADRAALESRRLRLHHLRGSSALAYESDLVILMNDKTEAVSNVHLAFDPVRAQEFRNYTVFSIEKNRGGPSNVDMEFRKDFANFRFDPIGEYVTDRLIDGRIYTE